jgi:hypothetical protein
VTAGATEVDRYKSIETLLHFFFGYETPTNVLFSRGKAVTFGQAVMSYAEINNSFF